MSGRFVLSALPGWPAGDADTRNCFRHELPAGCTAFSSSGKYRADRFVLPAESLPGPGLCHQTQTQMKRPSTEIAGFVTSLDPSRTRRAIPALRDTTSLATRIWRYAKQFLLPARKPAKAHWLLPHEFVAVESMPQQSVHGIEVCVLSPSPCTAGLALFTDSSIGTRSCSQRKKMPPFDCPAARARIRHRHCNFRRACMPIPELSVQCGERRRPRIGDRRYPTGSEREGAKFNRRALRTFVPQPPGAAPQGILRAQPSREK